MTEKIFGKGEIVFREGDMGACFYQIKEGTAGVYVNYGTDAQKKEGFLARLKKYKEFGTLGRKLTGCSRCKT